MFTQSRSWVARGEDAIPITREGMKISIFFLSQQLARVGIFYLDANQTFKSIWPGSKSLLLCVMSSSFIVVAYIMETVFSNMQLNSSNPHNCQTDTFQKKMACRKDP